MTLYLASYTFSSWKMFWDTGKSYYEDTSSEKVGSVKIPLNTRILCIKIDDKSREKGFILSSSNGIVSDTSWECTSNETQNVWPSASAVVAKPHAKVFPNNIPNAQWIWTDNQWDTRVVCKKTLIGE